jgi:PAS domain S-box-containing protein
VRKAQRRSTTAAGARRAAAGARVATGAAREADAPRRVVRVRRPAAREQALRVPKPQAMLSEVLELSRRVPVDLHEDEIVHAYVTSFSRLFPRRLFCVRLFASEDRSLSTVYANGRLSPARRDRRELSNAAARQHGVAEGVARDNDVQLVQSYTPLFKHGVSGFDIPMLDGSELLGLVSVEYPRDVQPAREDRAALVPLSLWFSSTLKNARSHRRSIYLRDYLSKLLDHANAPIMVMGKRGEVRLANRAFLALLSFLRDELLDREWMSFLPEAEQRHLWPIYINALRGEPTTNVEVQLPRRDGSFARVAVNAASILGPDGDVEGVIYIYRDITELRELEQQIIHAEKLATLGQLAAGVVHELNNPLTSICVYSEYLLKKGQAESAPAADVEKLRRITVSAERMLKFTRDLVTYARPPSERPTALDISEVVEQAVVFCSHVLEECGAKVAQTFEPDAPQVYGVKAQLVQVLINLITNACHAMPLGAGQVRFESRSLGDGRLLLCVSDNGRGIPEENLKQIFEPFFTTKSEGQGTGLGLSIVRNIVEQHRGEIRVSSEVGRGTRFEITLACRPLTPEALPET